jgi:hypothetical protein
VSLTFTSAGCGTYSGVAIGSPFPRSWPPVGRVDTAALTLRGRAVRRHPVIAWS